MQVPVLSRGVMRVTSPEPLFIAVMQVPVLSRRRGHAGTQSRASFFILLIYFNFIWHGSYRFQSWTRDFNLDNT
jgi:hypothetical protein